MELRHLRYFVAVAEEKSVTRAALRLHVSQPPLSRQIRDLENELGVNLFDRSASGVRLTGAGVLFLAKANGVLQRAQDAADAVRAFALGKHGNVCVGFASGTIGLLGRALRSFSRTHPQIGVELREMTTQAILRGLRDRKLDVAFVVPTSPRDFDGLVVDELAAFPTGVVVSKRHRFARLREVPLKEVAREPIVERSRAEFPEAHAAMLKILAPYTASPNLVGEHDSFASLLAAVEAGRGVAFLIQVKSLIAGKRLELRPVTPALPLIPLAVAYHEDAVSDAAAAFLAVTRAARPKRSRSSRPIFTT
jgi:DNA-binding transcriptional LysR family regulator